MSGSVNKVIIVGNLGADPEVRSMQNGDEVAQLSIATSELWKCKQTGERKSRTEWHRVVLFNSALVSLAKNYMRKGSKIYVEGQLETRKWQDQSGQDKYTTEVVLRPYRGGITLLDSKKEGDSYQEPLQETGDTMHQDFEDDIPFMNYIGVDGF